MNADARCWRVFLGSVSSVKFHLRKYNARNIKYVGFETADEKTYQHVTFEMVVDIFPLFSDTFQSK